IVLSTHGRTGYSRLWLGSIADAIARHAATPVLMLRHRGADAALEVPPHQFANILVPLDGSDLADSVLPHATSLAEAFGSRLTLLRVVTPMPAPAALYAVPLAVPPSYIDETLSARIEAAQGYVQAVAGRLHGDDGKLEIRTEVRVSETPATSILEMTALQA